MTSSEMQILKPSDTQIYVKITSCLRKFDCVKGYSSGNRGEKLSNFKQQCSFSRGLLRLAPVSEVTDPFLQSSPSVVCVVTLYYDNLQFNRN